jgi:hypothetical protein
MTGALDYQDRAWLGGPSPDPAWHLTLFAETPTFRQFWRRVAAKMASRR